MSIHGNLVAKGGAYAYWHKIPYISVIHFVALIGMLSYMALTLIHSFTGFIEQQYANGGEVTLETVK